jgi:hypothetical protein
LLPRDFLKRHDATPIKRQSAGFGSPSLPTVIAGIALAAAVILTGLLLKRRPAVRLVTGSVACLVAGVLFLNSSCSPRPVPVDGGVGLRRDDVHLRDRRAWAPFRSTYPPSVTADGSIAGEILLEEGHSGDALRLMVDQETLQGLTEKTAQNPGAKK